MHDPPLLLYIASMGIFDTVLLDKPRTCTVCGAQIDQVQTKVFDPMLREYTPGDIIAGSPVLAGVVEEDLFCPGCNSVSQKIYFSVWHTLLVGIYDTVDEAEEQMMSVDRSDLLDHIARHQERALIWHNRFSRLYGEIQNLHDYLQNADKKESIQPGSRFYRIRDIVSGNDPLGALIEAHRPVNPEDEKELFPEE